MAESDGPHLILENRHTGERLALRRVVQGNDVWLELKGSLPPHREAVLILPRPIQAVLFRVLVAVGTLLGRYRGSDWPGCPARCLGAPTQCGGRCLARRCGRRTARHFCRCVISSANATRWVLFSP